MGSSHKQSGLGSILALDLKGPIGENKLKFLEQLRKYSKGTRIKGVLIRINSPGGAVSTS